MFSCILQTPSRCNWLQFQSATTSCKSAWDTLPYFGINGLSMILCLWSPLHPLSKLIAIQDHAQNLEEQLWIGGRREVSIISYRPVTGSDLKQERSFFRGSVSTFLQLVVAIILFRFMNIEKERKKEILAIYRLWSSFHFSLKTSFGR